MEEDSYRNCKAVPARRGHRQSVVSAVQQAKKQDKKKNCQKTNKLYLFTNSNEKAKI